MNFDRVYRACTAVHNTVWPIGLRFGTPSDRLHPDLIHGRVHSGTLGYPVATHRNRCNHVVSLTVTVSTPGLDSPLVTTTNPKARLPQADKDASVRFPGSDIPHVSLVSGPGIFAERAPTSTSDLLRFAR